MIGWLVVKGRALAWDWRRAGDVRCLVVVSWELCDLVLWETGGVAGNWGTGAGSTMLQGVTGAWVVRCNGTEGWGEEVEARDWGEGSWICWLLVVVQIAVETGLTEGWACESGESEVELTAAAWSFKVWTVEPLFLILAWRTEGAVSLQTGWCYHEWQWVMIQLAAF